MPMLEFSFRIRRAFVFTRIARGRIISARNPHQVSVDKNFRTCCTYHTNMVFATSELPVLCKSTDKNIEAETSSSAWFQFNVSLWIFPSALLRGGGMYNTVLLVVCECSKKWTSYFLQKPSCGDYCISDTNCQLRQRSDWDGAKSRGNGNY